jgi:hypothetical protein
MKTCKISWLWFLLVRKTYPWTTLLITALRIFSQRGLQRYREQARFWMAYAKIDFVGVMAAMNDMLW